jgi:hypothetical protein
VLVHEGCYGHLAVFNATVREFGIPVAEYQHGMITQGHDAYNVAPRLAASDEYRQTLPDEFLAYGSWWNEQFNAPVARKVVIGNPHRTETLRTWRPEQGRATVLVLGDGAETAARLDLSRRLAAMLPRPFSVVYRPHPREREVAERLSDGAVTIDASPDLYETLERAAALVGEPSTVLFEAVGLVPRIFVWDTAKTRFYLGDHPFERFVDPAEVAERLVAGARGEPQIDVADLWADDWQGRFRRYAAAKLG